MTQPVEVTRRYVALEYDGTNGAAFVALLAASSGIDPESWSVVSEEGGTLVIGCTNENYSPPQVATGDVLVVTPGVTFQVFTAAAYADQFAPLP